MIPMRLLRSNPYFAHLFARVHPLCWPILWWSLNRLLKWYETSGYEEILFGTTRWGYVYVAFLGDKIPDPSVYRPYARMKPRWDDPVWETQVPVAFLPLAMALALPHRVGFGGRVQHGMLAEWAPPLFRSNTS